MTTDQQNHLVSVTEQAKGLVNEINQLEAQAKNKRELLLKLQGIIEYLQQTGVQLPEQHVHEHSPAEVVTPEEDASDK